MHWGRFSCGRVRSNGRQLFAATPRNRERVEQGNAGHCTRAGSGRSDLQGLYIDRCSSAHTAPVSLTFSSIFNCGRLHSLRDCTPYDIWHYRASALLHCVYGLPVRLPPIPTWIDRGSCSWTWSVQLSTLRQLLVRDFSLSGNAQAWAIVEQSNWSFRSTAIWRRPGPPYGPNTGFWSFAVDCVDERRRHGNTALASILIRGEETARRNSG